MLNTAEGQWSKTYRESHKDNFEAKLYNGLDCQVNHLASVQLNICFIAEDEAEGKTVLEIAAVQIWLRIIRQLIMFVGRRL